MSLSVWFSLLCNCWMSLNLLRLFVVADCPATDSLLAWPGWQPQLTVLVYGTVQLCTVSTRYITARLSRKSVNSALGQPGHDSGAWYSAPCQWPIFVSCNVWQTVTVCTLLLGGLDEIGGEDDFQWISTLYECQTYSSLTNTYANTHKGYYFSLSIKMKGIFYDSPGSSWLSTSE